MTYTGRMLGLVACLVGMVACGKSDPLEGEVKALETAGLTSIDLKETDAAALQASSCKAGTVEQLSALLCSYESADAAKAGKAPAEAWLGDALTGVVLRREGLLLALADEKSIDPNGKTMAKVAKLFTHAEPSANP